MATVAVSDGLESGPAGNRVLSPRQKAAVIVRLLLSQDVSPGLDRLSPDQQGDLARALASLGPVDRGTLRTVIRDFTRALDDLALTTPPDLAAAVTLLEPHISPLARDTLRSKADAGDGTDPWAQIGRLPTDRLHPLLLSEGVEVCAVLVSKLGVSKAAELLSGLPGDRANIIAHAVHLTATVAPETVDQIGAHLLRRLDADPVSAFLSGPVDRVSAILNAVTSQARDAVLDGLSQRDQAFADDVRRAIFTFQHIPKRVDPADVPRILRQIDPDQLATALAAGIKAHPVVVEFLLENMSKRLAEQLRDEAEAGDIQLIPADS